MVLASCFLRSPFYRPSRRESAQWMTAKGLSHAIQSGNNRPPLKKAISMEHSAFGQTADGRKASLFRAGNEHLQVAFTDDGARMVSIMSRDRHGAWDHVLLGHDSAEAYAAEGGSLGVVLGRYANRIAGGDLRIDGAHHRLATNENGNTRHGGPDGFGKRLWEVVRHDAESITFGLNSPDGDQGFPGEVYAEAEYRLAGDTLWLTLTAQTDKPTAINLSVHPYFNLGTSGTIHDHIIQIAATQYLATDSAQIPFSPPRFVADTPFDCQQPAVLGAILLSNHPQLKIAGGLDHCFCLDGRVTENPRNVAGLYHPDNGRLLRIMTTQAGLQVYTGNNLTGQFKGLNGLLHQRYAGIALEAQNYPDAPHHSSFPYSIVKPGELYRHQIGFQFTTG
ncbi:Aldose 1-epimerase [Granulibacter bethesdensis]|nr:Aldose 1-epimerase [Granulibacter bethesdensis]